MSDWIQIKTQNNTTHYVEQSLATGHYPNYSVLEEYLKEFPHFAVTVSVNAYQRWSTTVGGIDHSALMKIVCHSSPLKVLLPVEVLTLEASVEFEIPDTPNPSWQNIRVYYHKCPARFFTCKPRLTMSLQGFLKKFFKLKPTEELLTEILDCLRNYNIPPFDPNDYEFHYSRGDGVCAKEHFFQAYQNINPEGYYDVYPSVIGSCMRHKSWMFKGETLGVELPHPLEAYLTKDVGIAWLIDKDGYTVARTLTNEVHKTIVRVYSSAPKVKGSDTHWRQCRAEEIRDYLIQCLPDYSVCERGGLCGCQLNTESIGGGFYIIPYLDGDHTHVGVESGVVGDDDGEFLDATEHDPPAVRALRRCAGCYLECYSDTVRNGGGMSGWLCLSCIEEVNSNASYEE